MKASRTSSWLRRARAGWPNAFPHATGARRRSAANADGRSSTSSSAKSMSVSRSLGKVIAIAAPFSQGAVLSGHRLAAAPRHQRPGPREDLLGHVGEAAVGLLDGLAREDRPPVHVLDV